MARQEILFHKLEKKLNKYDEYYKLEKKIHVLLHIF